MAIWQHDDWQQQDGPDAQLARLVLHHQEVAAKLGPEISGDGASRSTNALLQYLASIEENIRRLERVTGTAQPRAEIIRADFGGGGRI